jgi:hypothetical protein
MSSDPGKTALEGAAPAAVPDRLDPNEPTLLERNLRLTLEERLEQLVRAVRFIEAGRAALKDGRG